jgi:hypothetical protein
MRAGRAPITIANLLADATPPLVAEQPKVDLPSQASRGLTGSGGLRAHVDGEGAAFANVGPRSATALGQRVKEWVLRRSGHNAQTAPSRQHFPLRDGRGASLDVYVRGAAPGSLTRELGLASPCTPRRVSPGAMGPARARLTPAQ